MPYIFFENVQINPFKYRESLDNPLKYFLVQFTTLNYVI